MISCFIYVCIFYFCSVSQLNFQKGKNVYVIHKGLILVASNKRVYVEHIVNVNKYSGLTFNLGFAILFVFKANKSAPKIFVHCQYS